MVLGSFIAGRIETGHVTGDIGGGWAWVWDELGSGTLAEFASIGVGDGDVGGWVGAFLQVALFLR